MIYTLDTISLSRFIDVFLGDINKAVEGDYTENEKKDAAESMCHEYMSIVSGKSVASLLVKRNSILKIEMRRTCLEVCRILATAGYTADSCMVFKGLGYSVADNKDTILAKVESILASDSYQLDKLTAHDAEPMTRDSFTKEKVAIMAHLKMYIDDNVFKAKEYAYLVKQVNDEIEAMMKTYKK